MTPPVVIVGAGVAGCVAARTLVETGVDVLVLEAGPGPARPAVLDSIDHLRSAEAADWWFPDLPRRGRGVGGSSSVNGMVLDAIHPLDMKRWGWDDALEDQRWLLERWPHTHIAAGPFTSAIGSCVQEGFPSAAATHRSGWSGWAPLSLAFDGSKRWSAYDAFLTPRSTAESEVLLRTSAAVAKVLVDGSNPVVELASGELIDASLVLIAAGTTGSPALLVNSGLISADDVAEPLNHASTAIIVELDERLQNHQPLSAPSSHMLRTVTGLTENTVDLQMLFLDHTGADEAGRRHGAVIVSALEPDRQKVLIAGITQALHWLRSIDGVLSVALSDDPSPVQHHACTLTETPRAIPGVRVIDASVLPALPHTNPMLSVAIGARRAARSSISGVERRP